MDLLFNISETILDFENLLGDIQRQITKICRDDCISPKIAEKCFH